MRHKCCVCGKSIRFSAFLGNQGQKLSNGYVCNDCCKKVGCDKAVFETMGLSMLSVDEFKSKFNIQPQKNNPDSSTQLDYTADANPNNDLAEYVRSNFTADRYLEAIKYVKETTRWGLKEAKDYVDSIFNMPKN